MKFKISGYGEDSLVKSSNLIIRQQWREMTLESLQLSTDKTRSRVCGDFQDRFGVGDKLIYVATLQPNHCEISQDTLASNFYRTMLGLHVTPEMLQEEVTTSRSAPVQYAR